ncbi:PA2169 family four-helix-bundle protein [Mucilaginibacter sp. HMF5004]|uniref:PA2169 family four-helix-bundle protein n=1 Tax=Mucilaginibacter rivuli TaxID=2857527 RepID=UPI001C5EBD59|nr:PA2169 family four-helix-bundle protein [Mucilaginibacter rivuli]MBW4890999.1 PA2169 family four-helix-bundle protein [Mucilaginibacter rivuli]
METKEETLDILNDLIRINNDRIMGYERAIKELQDEDADLKALFTKMIGESHNFKLELGTEVQALGEDMTTEATTAGSIYRAWMDVKAAFTGHDRESIIAACERGEDAAKSAYRAALEDDELPAFLSEIILRQSAIQQAAHDQIKALRDAS